MTNEEIKQRNIDIAIYRGAERVEEPQGNNWLKIPEIGTFGDHQLKYHSSWDWLMPVAQEVLLKSQVWTFSNLLKQKIGSIDIESAFITISDFCKDRNKK